MVEALASLLGAVPSPDGLDPLQSPSLKQLDATALGSTGKGDLGAMTEWYPHGTAMHQHLFLRIGPNPDDVVPNGEILLDIIPNVWASLGQTQHHRGSYTSLKGPVSTGSISYSTHANQRNLLGSRTRGVHTTAATNAPGQGDCGGALLLTTHRLIFLTGSPRPLFVPLAAIATTNVKRHTPSRGSVTEATDGGGDDGSSGGGGGGSGGGTGGGGGDNFGTTHPYTCLEVLCLDARRFSFEVADTDNDASAGAAASSASAAAAGNGDTTSPAEENDADGVELANSDDENPFVDTGGDVASGTMSGNGLAVPHDPNLQAPKPSPATPPGLTVKAPQGGRQSLAGTVFFDDPLDVYYLNEEWEAAKRQSKEVVRANGEGKLPGERCVHRSRRYFSTSPRLAPPRPAPPRPIPPRPTSLHPPPRQSQT